jgi:hypothetical protein
MVWRRTVGTVKGVRVENDLLQIDLGPANPQAVQKAEVRARE